MEGLQVHAKVNPGVGAIHIAKTKMGKGARSDDSVLLGIGIQTINSLIRVMSIL